MASGLERISANVTSILSSVRRYQAMAKVQEAASRVQATLGLEPEIGSLDDTDLPALQKSIEKSLRQWVHSGQDGQAPAPKVAETTRQPEAEKQPEPQAVIQQAAASPTLDQPQAAAATPAQPSVVATAEPAPALPAAPAVAAAPAKTGKPAKARAADAEWYRPARKPALIASFQK